MDHDAFIFFMWLFKEISNPSGRPFPKLDLVGVGLNVQNIYFLGPFRDRGA